MSDCYYNNDCDSSSISGGVIAIIIIAVIIFIAKIALIIWCCNRASRRSARRDQEIQIRQSDGAFVANSATELGYTQNEDVSRYGRSVWNNGGGVYRPEDTGNGKNANGVVEPLPVYSRETPMYPVLPRYGEGR